MSSKTIALPKTGSRFGHAYDYYRACDRKVSHRPLWTEPRDGSELCSSTSGDAGERGDETLTDGLETTSEDEGYEYYVVHDGQGGTRVLKRPKSAIYPSIGCVGCSD